MKRWTVIAGVFLVLLAVGGWQWQQQRRTGLIRLAVPARPDLSGWVGELEQQIDRCEKRIAADDEALVALGQISRLYHANGFLSEASVCYEALEKLEPREARWFHRHAVILAGFGALDEAEVRWRRVVALAPDYVNARLRLGDLRLKRNDTKGATAEYQLVLQRNPEDPYATLGLGRSAAQEQRWADACGYLERTVQLSSYRVGYDLLVTAYERLGRGQDADRIRARSRAIGTYVDPPDPWIRELDEDSFDAFQLSLSASVAESDGNLALADKRLQRAITLAPDQVSLYFQQGNLLLKQKQYGAARQRFEHCVRIQPDFSDGWAFLSALHETVGDRPAAERTLLEGLRACPESPGLHLQNARRLVRDGRLDEAVTEFRTAARLRPNEAEAFIGLALALFRQGHKSEALVVLDEALAAEPQNPAALSLRAFHAVTEGAKNEARRWLRQVLDQPRVEPGDRAQLLSAYRDRFGADFE